MVATSATVSKDSLKMSDTTGNKAKHIEIPEVC